MAAYATFTDVEARAGRYAPLFSVAGKQPDQPTVTGLLANTAAEIDGAIKARGFDPVTMDAAAKAALLDLNAYGALSRALASVPSGDKGLDDLKAYAQKLWTAGMEAIAKGSHAAIALLEASGGGASAGSFWGDEPGYDPWGAEETDLSDSLAPSLRKGQAL